MQTYRLKNIIIMILVLVNVCLLGLLGNHQAAQRSARQSSNEQLSALFQSEGISLEPDLIPEDSTLAPLTLSRSTERDQALAESILGEGLTVSDEGGGIYLYTGQAGTARFRANGAFDIAVVDMPDETPEALCRRICRKFGYGELQGRLNGGTGTYSAPLLWGGVEVVNCSISFTFSKNVLTSVSGYALPDHTAPAPAEGSMSASTALTLFLQSRTTTDAISVASAVTSISAGYLLESTPAAPLSLTPVWQIGTDTYKYYVNFSTRVVTQS